MYLIAVRQPDGYFTTYKEYQHYTSAACDLEARIQADPRIKGRVFKCVCEMEADVSVKTVNKEKVGDEG